MGGTQIRIKLAEKEYTLNTTPEEALTLKQAGKQLNEEIRLLQKRTGIWDKQDLLVMVAFDNVVKKLKQTQAAQEQAEHIDELSTTIEQALNGD